MPCFTRFFPRQHRLREFPLLLATLLCSLAPAGCAAVDCANYEDVDPWLELGTGTSAFETLDEATRLALTYGPQGGAHFSSSIRFGGFLAGYDTPPPPPSDDRARVTGRSRPVLEVSLIAQWEEDGEGLDDWVIASYGPYEVQPQGDEVRGVWMSAHPDLWDSMGEDWNLQPGETSQFARNQQAIAAQTLRYLGSFTDVCGTRVSVETTARVSFSPPPW